MGVIGETAEWRKYLACKHKARILDPQKPHKKLVAQLLSPHLGSGGRGILRAGLSLGFSERLCLSSEVVPASSLYAHTYTYPPHRRTHTHICIHTAHS